MATNADVVALAIASAERVFNSSMEEAKRIHEKGSFDRASNLRANAHSTYARSMEAISKMIAPATSTVIVD